MPTTKVNIGGREVFQGLVISSVIVMANEVVNRRFKIFLHEVIFQQDAVLQRLMPALDLALRLRMVRCAPHVSDLLARQLVGEIASDVRQAIVREQSRPVRHGRFLDTGRIKRKLQGIGHVVCFHRRAEFPGDDIA